VRFFLLDVHCKVTNFCEFSARFEAEVLVSSSN